MNRRQFIRTGATALASGLLPLEPVLGAAPGPVVWDIHGSPAASVEALFASLGGLERIMPTDPGRAVVLLKPNICFPHAAAMGTTTSPGLVVALCEFLSARGVGKIIVADHTLKANTFERMELIRAVGDCPAAKVVLPDEQRWYRPPQVHGRALAQTDVLKMLQRADLLINLATAKHHSATHVSLATKNLMGLIWDRAVFHTQLDLAQAIGDLPLVIRPRLNIVDASRVLLTGGPTGPGSVVREDRLFASSDILSLDAVVASRYAFGRRTLSPLEIPHLAAAHRNRVGEIDPQKIEVQQLEA